MQHFETRAAASDSCTEKPPSCLRRYFRIHISGLYRLDKTKLYCCSDQEIQITQITVQTNHVPRPSGFSKIRYFSRKILVIGYLIELPAIPSPSHDIQL